MTRCGSKVGGSLHNVLNTPPCFGASLSETELLALRSGAIAGCVERAAGGVEVGGGDSLEAVSESPLQPTTAISIRLMAAVKNVLLIEFDPNFNLFNPLWASLRLILS